MQSLIGPITNPARDHHHRTAQHNYQRRSSPTPDDNKRNGFSPRHYRRRRVDIYRTLEFDPTHSVNIIIFLFYQTGPRLIEISI